MSEERPDCPTPPNPSSEQINQLAITVLAAGLVGIGGLLYGLNNQVIVLTSNVSSLSKEVERVQSVGDVNAERIRSLEMDGSKRK